MLFVARRIHRRRQVRKIRGKVLVVVFAVLLCTAVLAGVAICFNNGKCLLPFNGYFTASAKQVLSVIAHQDLDRSIKDMNKVDKHFLSITAGMGEEIEADNITAAT